MTNIEILDDVTITLVDHMGDDESIARAARVSVVGATHEEDDAKHADSLAKGMTGLTGDDAARYLMTYFSDLKAEQDKKDAGLINYLARERHGSPFEHTAMTFYAEGPIAAFREFQRHRIASYNEMSGRYTILPSRFYAPNADRPLINVGSSARPEFAPGTPEQIELVKTVLENQYRSAWDAYVTMTDAGIANEVARFVLPVGIMSQMYVTMNLRAMFNFLSLRTSNEEATFRSRPQHEIELMAKKMETEVERLFPAAYAAWNKNGRVAP